MRSLFLLNSQLVIFRTVISDGSQMHTEKLTTESLSVDFIIRLILSLPLSTWITQRLIAIVAGIDCRLIFMATIRPLSHSSDIVGPFDCTSKLRIRINAQCIALFVHKSP